MFYSKTSSINQQNKTEKIGKWEGKILIVKTMGAMMDKKPQPSNNIIQ